MKLINQLSVTGNGKTNIMNHYHIMVIMHIKLIKP
jgi:hypothetical protein